MRLDASLGIGGGQVLRTALGISAARATPVELFNVRKGRPKPGLRPQHMAGARALAEICIGRLDGCVEGSTEISFAPGPVRPGDYSFDVGTAGSAALVLQTIIPAMMGASGRVSVEITGGTDVPKAPQWDYFAEVLAPALESSGCTIVRSIARRGYAPRGGGVVRVSVEPAARPGPIVLAGGAVPLTISGRVHSCGLPGHVAERIRSSAADALGIPADSIDIERAPDGPSKGCGIVLWARGPGRIMGASCLGEVRLSSEKVGSRAARALIEDMASGASADSHLADQLAPFLAMWGGSLTCREATGHLRTNIETVRTVLGVEISLERRGGLFEVRSAGPGTQPVMP